MVFDKSFAVAKVRRARCRSRGATVAEMALLTPLLFFLTAGAFEVGRGVWIKHTLSHVAREASRYAAVRSVRSDDPATIDKIAARIRREANGMDTSRLKITANWSPSNHPGATVQVEVAYVFRPVTPFLPFTSIQLRSNSERLITY